MSRAPGFYLALALGLAGWVVFLGLAMALRLPVPGLGRLLREHAAALYLGIVAYLMVLTPALLTTSLYHLWRGELTLARSTLLLLSFLGGSFLLLRLFRPALLAGFPG
jgi:hypothetical protein